MPPCLLLCLFAFISPSSAQTNAPKSLVVGYFGQWSLYNDPPYKVRDLAVGGKAAMLDQLNYAQAFVTGGRCSVADPNADLNRTFTAAESVNGTPDDSASPFRGNLHQLAELKQAYPHLKTFISLEGRASDFAYDAQPEHRQAFIASCIDTFIKGNLAQGISAPTLFDGIDIDWEYPAAPDAADFLALLTGFRQELERIRPGLKLSVAVGPSPRMYSGSDFHTIAAQVDEIGLMTYDFAGPWMQTTGLIAPLYSVAIPAPPGNAPLPVVPLAAAPAAAPTGSNPTASTTPAARAALPAGALPSSTPAPRPPPAGGASASAQSFVDAGVPAAKLLLGIPFYGYGWTAVPDVADGLFQEGTPIRGDRPYSFIQSLATRSTLHRDPISQTPWLFDGDAFWTFDDPISVGAKASYALDHQLGGLMIWELSEDTPQGTLLTAAHDVLSGLPTRPALSEAQSIGKPQTPGPSQ